MVQYIVSKDRVRREARLKINKIFADAGFVIEFDSIYRVRISKSFTRFFTEWMKKDGCYCLNDDSKTVVIYGDRKLFEKIAEQIEGQGFNVIVSC